jgi:hypothetical protein
VTGARLRITPAARPTLSVCLANVYPGLSEYDDDIWTMLCDFHSTVEARVGARRSVKTDGYDFAYLFPIFLTCGALVARTTPDLGSPIGWTISARDKDEFIRRLSKTLSQLLVSFS